MVRVSGGATGKLPALMFQVQPKILLKDLNAGAQKVDPEFSIHKS